MKRRPYAVLGSVALLLALPACSHFQRPATTPQATLPAQAVPAAWLASPVPQTASSTPTAQPIEDPLLAALQARVLANSTSLAQVKNNVATARAALTSSQANALPQLNANASFNRSASGFLGNVFISNQSQAGFQASWELDLFGLIARQSEAALARLQQNVNLMAQVQESLRSETASLLVQRRLCEAQLDMLKQESASAKAVLSALEKTRAVGLRSESDVLKFKSQVVDYDNAVTQQQASCDAQVKALVALSAYPEGELRALLKLAHGLLPKATVAPVVVVPAEALSNRPDVRALLWAVDAASADLGAEQAARYPRLSLSGSIAPTRFESAQFGSFNYRAWSIGPSVSLPVFDGGRREASIEAAKSAYELARQELEAKVRDAVKEVEQALVDLHSQDQQSKVLQTYQRDLLAQTRRSEQQFTVGLINGLDLEQDRRNQWAAQRQVNQNQAAQILAMLNLHRALGGTWASSE